MKIKNTQNVFHTIVVVALMKHLCEEIKKNELLPKKKTQKTVHENCFHSLALENYNYKHNMWVAY